MKNLKLFLYLSLGLLLVAFFSSCTSSKKFKSKTTEKIETAATLHTEATEVSTTDSSTIEYSDSSFAQTQKINISFDNNFAINQNETDPFAERENEYEGAPVKKKVEKTQIAKTTTLDFKYNINGYIISSAVPIKNINLVDERTGKITAVNITQQSNYDSSQKKAAATTATKTETVTSTKGKKQTSYLWILIVIACIIGCWLLYQIPWVKRIVHGFFALFRKKQKEDPSNLKS